MCLLDMEQHQKERSNEVWTLLGFALVLSFWF